MTALSWLAGVGLGLCVSSGLGIAAVLGGHQWPLSVYWQVVSFCVGLVVFAEFLGKSSVAGVHAVADAVIHWQATRPPAPVQTVQTDELDEPDVPGVDEALE